MPDGGKTQESKSAKLSAELTAEAEKLAALPESRSVRRDDPRFGRWIHAIHSEARTAFELAEQLRSRKLRYRSMPFMSWNNFVSCGWQSNACRN